MRLLWITLFITTALAQDVPTGIVKAGAATMLRTDTKTSAGPLGTFKTTLDLFAGGFQATDYTNYTPPPPDPNVTLTKFDNCVVTVVTAAPATVDTGIVITALDAGPVWTLNGPNGTKQFAQTAKLAYGATLGGGLALPIPGAPPPPPLYLDPGTYTIDNGDGGADIGPFSATLVLPDPPFVWTNADDITTIDRSAGVQINWSGGDPNSKVNINGIVTLIDSATNKPGGSGVFLCTVDNTGSFFVSSDVLSLLPATPPSAVAAPTSLLTVGTLVQTRFDAPGSDASLFSFTAGASRIVTYQ